MKSIFEHIVPRNEFSPPEKVVRSLEENFGTFLNVEWFEEDGLYEAVFYHDEMECIALFDKEGVLQVYKRNLALHRVSKAVANQAAAVGELMNLIEITQHGKLYFEIIARDKYLDRFFLLLEEDGTVIEKRKL